MDSTAPKSPRTAAEAGWHISRYNLYAKVPGSDKLAVYNTLNRTCFEYSTLEAYALESLGDFSESHPLIAHMAHQGTIACHDERAAHLAQKLAEASTPPNGVVSMIVCPTLACNFECPYCFESRRPGKMSPEVQDDVVALACRMLDAGHASGLRITWFGGEPLLGADVIEALTPRLVAAAEERGASYEAWIFTNGYLISPEVIDMLGRCKVNRVHIPLDGVGATNDASRRLVGGGPTFERIIENIGLLKPPMRVMVRANTHAGNVGQLDELKHILRTRADETGVDLDFYPAALVDVSPADDVSNPMFDYAFHSLEVMLRPEMRHIPVGEDHVCNAQNLYMLTVDERGGLYMSGGMACGKDEYVYGSAHDWDPADPIATASKPEMISSYLGTVVTDPSSECYDCPWLPLCGGGCPHLRLFGKHSCPPYKDAPERFVLATRDRLDKRQGEGPAPA